MTGAHEEGLLGDEGLQTMLAKLKDAGFQAQVQSWLDKNKDNLPITADQVARRSARAADRQVARHSDGSGARGVGKVPARGRERGRIGGSPALGGQAKYLGLSRRVKPILLG